MTTPGNRPLTALAQGPGCPSLPGDTDAAAAVGAASTIPRSLLGSSRAGASSTTRLLLIVDQFEELFTLNPWEVQERFAELLGRLALEADVHVLLVDAG